MKRSTRPALIVIALLLLGGCAYWYDPAAAPRQPLSEQQHQVRITRRDSSTVVLSRAVFHADSVSGIAGNRRVAVAVSDITYVQYRRPGKVPTQGVTGVAVLFGLLVGVFSALVLLFPSE
ncbi:MAG TPA: hypothetical protein VF665_16915 [Longimicrobium sp.]|jgi:hypothetical protein|uniref:hypothetical protein n=1 Tax=Longimicrobium sp. TaxID=2029185 RepID=UPI002EDA06D3